MFLQLILDERLVAAVLNDHELFEIVGEHVCSFNRSCNYGCIDSKFMVSIDSSNQDWSYVF